MIGVIATLKVQEGQNEPFEETARKLVAAVNELEPENLFYQLYRMGGRDYVFLERYKSRGSLDLHRESDHYKEHAGAMQAFLEGSPDVQVLDEV